MDIVNYAENNQMDPTGIYYGCFSYRRDSHFNNLQEKINLEDNRDVRIKHAPLTKRN